MPRPRSPTRRPRRCPSARTKRACATPFHVAQSPALRADHEKLGHRRPKRGGARSSGIGADKSVAELPQMWDGHEVVGKLYVYTNTRCMWDRDDNRGIARKSWGTRDKPSSSLSLTHPRRSPFAESFSAFAALCPSPHTSFHEQRCSEVDRAMSGTSARAREGIPLTLMLTRAFETTREDPKSLCV